MGTSDLPAVIYLQVSACPLKTRHFIILAELLRWKRRRCFAHDLPAVIYFTIVIYSFYNISDQLLPLETMTMYMTQKPSHLVFCLPLGIFPGSSTSTILFSTCPSSLLLSVIFFVYGATLLIVSHVRFRLYLSS